ncbi:hypothetical protein V1506DRAFT_386437 [Lipomyces tetrasporus]
MPLGCFAISTRGWVATPIQLQTTYGIILSTFAVYSLGVRGASLLDVTSSSGRISPANGLTWRRAAFALSQSEGLMRIMWEWATNIFEKLLLPMRLYSQIPESVKSSSSSRKTELSRDSDVKNIILARDGMISPVGRVIDKSAPRHIRQTASERVVRLQAAHIMSFKLAKYSAMQSLLSMFADTSVEAILRDRGINCPSNVFCTDPITHQSLTRIYACNFTTQKSKRVYGSTQKIQTPLRLHNGKIVNEITTSPHPN